MKDIIDIPDGLSHELAVCHRSLDKLDLKPIQIPNVTGSKVVEHPDFGPALKVFNNVTSYEACASRDQYFH